MTSKITTDICHQILKKKLKTVDYLLLNFSTQEINEKTGFLGQYLKLEIKIQMSSQVQTHYFFAKKVPQTGFSDFVLTSGSFQNEIFMFGKIFENMKNGMDIADCVPACFYSKTNEILVFEDLNHLGFKVADKHKPFELEEISILLKKLAKFHVATFVLEEKLSTQGKIFRIDQEFQSCIKETNYVKIDKHLGYEAVKSAVKGCLKMVDYFPPQSMEITPDEVKNMVTGFYDKIMYEQCSPSKKYRNVFCHGDLWANNIMLKYAEDTNKLIDCRYVDFQNVRICPPAHDVLALIYLTTSRELRQKYFQELLFLYHEELSRLLLEHDLRPEIVPLQEFLTCCQEFKLFAINFAVTMFPIVCLRAEEMEKLFQDKSLTEEVMFKDRGPFICQVCDRDPRYRKLLQDSLKDLWELCENLKNNN